MVSSLRLFKLHFVLKADYAGAFDKNITSITGSIDDNFQSIQVLKGNFAQQERDLKLLQSDVDDHREKIEYLMALMIGFALAIIKIPTLTLPLKNQKSKRN